MWTSHNQTLTGLEFSENVFDWSKFKPRSHDIFFSWTFELLWLTQVHIYCLEFIFHHITEILHLNTNSKENQSWNKNQHFHLFLSWNKNIFTCFVNINKHKNSLWAIFFYRFYLHFFRSSRSQIFFKIGALKGFAIF